jgi:hypothetical protein
LYDGRVPWGGDLVGSEDGDRVELEQRRYVCGGDGLLLLLLNAAAAGRMLVERGLLRAMIAGGLLRLRGSHAGGCADEKGQEAEQRDEEVQSFFHLRKV